ncbi:MAG: hypothetical protein K2O91_19160 [Lachnospiraceae bacterium]|nr:hypothetical protein [Lachnospiraceae bacterium]
MQPKEDKLHFLNRTINHMEDKDQTQAYHNNAYGLVEYIQNRDAFMVDLQGWQSRSSSMGRRLLRHISSKQRKQ